MNSSKFLLIFFVVFSIYCLDLQNESDMKTTNDLIESKISEYLENRKYPEGYDSLIASFNCENEKINDLVQVDGLGKVFDSYKLPQEIKDLINSSLKYSITNNLSNKAETFSNKMISKREEYIVIAISDGNNVVFQIIHSVVTANLHPIFHKVPTEVCKSTLLGKKCHTEYIDEEREPNEEELKIINAAIMAKMAEEIKN